MSAFPCGCDFDCKPKAHYCDCYPACVGGGFLAGFYGSWTPEQARAATMLSKEEERDIERERAAQGLAGSGITMKELEDKGYISKPDLHPIVIVREAPTRASTFPKDAAGRKRTPVGTGVLDYFPDAMVAIAQVSHAGNEQHNPGQPLHWDRAKSTDESDALMRHYLERGTFDDDGQRHSAKMAWRALALLQKEIEEERKSSAPPKMLTAVDIKAGAKSPIECYGIEKHTHPQCEKCRAARKCLTIAGQIARGER